MEAVVRAMEEATGGTIRGQQSKIFRGYAYAWIARTQPTGKRTMLVAKRAFGASVPSRCA